MSAKHTPFPYPSERDPQGIPPSYLAEFPYEIAVAAKALSDAIFEAASDQDAETLAAASLLAERNRATASPRPETVGVSDAIVERALDGNEIWEWLFGHLEGDVPSVLDDGLLNELAQHINTYFIRTAASPRPETVAEPMAWERVRRAYEILSSGEPPFTARECKASYALSQALTAALSPQEP